MRFFSATLVRCVLLVLVWVTALAAVSTLFAPEVTRATHAIVAAAQPRAALAQATTTEAERSAESAPDAVPDAIEDDAVVLPQPAARQTGDLGRHVTAGDPVVAPPRDQHRLVHTRPPARS